MNIVVILLVVSYIVWRSQEELPDAKTVWRDAVKYRGLLYIRDSNTNGVTIWYSWMTPRKHWKRENTHMVVALNKCPVSVIKEFQAQADRRALGQRL